jgi:hypothetical protein
MWANSALQFCRTFGVSLPEARAFQCTAEHLQARQDGGDNSQKNIAAACWLCNQRRHKRSVALKPDEFRQLVQFRVARKKWHISRAFEAGVL